jgi:hypothetical protein
MGAIAREWVRGRETDGQDRTRALGRGRMNGTLVEACLNRESLESFFIPTNDVEAVGMMCAAIATLCTYVRRLLVGGSEEHTTLKSGQRPFVNCQWPNKEAKPIGVS